MSFTLLRSSSSTARRRASARIAAGCVALAFTVAACGGGDDGGDKASDGKSAAESQGDTGGFPAECKPAPYSVTAVRDGAKPAGSATFGVVSAAAIPTPLVPNPDNAMPFEEVMKAGDTTDLLLYSLIFADEEFDAKSVDMFSGYTPVGSGKARGFISIAPISSAPLKVGDVVKPGELVLDLQTTLSQVGMDFKAAPDELNAYLETAVGQVTILGLSDSAICIDADLSWKYSDFGSEAVGTLQLKGVFSAPLAPRSIPFS
jgi:hypothetical protein